MNGPRFVIAAASLALALGTPPPSSAQCPASETRYSILELGTLGGATSYALQLDEQGRVVGGADTAAGPQHPVLWQDGVPIDLGTLGGAHGLASAINASGQIAGQADDTTGRRGAFLWESDAITDLGALAGLDSRGFDLNDAGVVVGISNAGFGYQHAFRWEDDVMIDLGLLEAGHDTAYANGINSSGVIAGWSGPGNGTTVALAWRRDGGPLVPLGTLGGSSSVPFGIDDSGRIVGWSYVAGGDRHAFVYEGGTMTDIGTLGGASSIAYGSNPAGDVVGYALTAAAAQHAAVWSAGPAADLNDLLPPGAGWELTTAAAINARGQIAGWGQIGGATRAFLMTPATLDVLALVDLLDGFDVPPGIANSLRVKLLHAQDGLDGCDSGFACARLATFLNQVEALSGKQLTLAQATALIEGAEAVRGTLGCP